MIQLSEEERTQALALVRGTIEALLEHATPPTCDCVALEQRAGAFVSLHKAGHLRGCMGWLEADHPLQETLRRMARVAAFEDPRFPALKSDEWPQCELEISILEPARDVAGWEEIEIGRHGIILEAHGHRAVFLPQVASEQGWTLEETLGHLCMKAGLPVDFWESGECRLQVFEALVIVSQG